MNNHFLTAEWLNLAMANYSVNSKILEKYIPAHTELDLWNDICYVSLVGFMFKNVKLKGISIPFHKDFEEVNLRFYVKHFDGNIWKRGVVFIKEIVPKAAITLVANSIYGENYQTLPMDHSWQIEKDKRIISYSWKNKIWNKIEVVTEPVSIQMESGSEAEFITEHYWGYTSKNNDSCSEYEVGHPQWRIFPVKNYTINVDFKSTYGSEFEFLNHAKPVSVFLAEGSEIFVNPSKTIK